MLFYRLKDDWKKNAIKIRPLIGYDRLDIIGKDSPLVTSNLCKVTEGQKAFDIIRFNDSLNIAISERVKILFDENEVTGCNLFPLKIIELESKYFGIQILSKAGPILNLKELHNGETENVLFDQNTWDGSDIFNLEGTLLYVCTSKVKILLEEFKTSNLSIKPL